MSLFGSNTLILPLVGVVARVHGPRVARPGVRLPGWVAGVRGSRRVAVVMIGLRLGVTLRRRSGVMTRPGLHAVLSRIQGASSGGKTTSGQTRRGGSASLLCDHTGSSDRPNRWRAAAGFSQLVGGGGCFHMRDYEQSRCWARRPTPASDSQTWDGDSVKNLCKVSQSSFSLCLCVFLLLLSSDLVHCLLCFVRKMAILTPVAGCIFSTIEGFHDFGPTRRCDVAATPYWRHSV